MDNSMNRMSNKKRILLILALLVAVTAYSNSNNRIISKSKISVKYCTRSTSRSISGQIDSIPRNNQIPRNIMEIGRRESQSISISAVLAAVLTLPLATKASAPPVMGVDREGYFNLCPEDPLSGCVSSQDDRPACFLAPWEYDGEYMNAKRKMLRYLSTVSGLKVTSGGNQEPSLESSLEFILPEENISRYIRAEVVTNNGNVEDDLEFYFTPNDNTIQYRSLRRKGYDFLGLDNKKRIEKMRLALRFLNIPILRNRRRVLFFVESPLDSFGPPTIMFDKLLDNISGEMEFKNGVIGDLDPMSPVWETPSTAAVKIRKAQEKEMMKK